MRRWPRVSMRIAMVGIALACIVAAWAGYQYRFNQGPRNTGWGRLRTTNNIETSFHYTRNMDGRFLRVIFVPERKYNPKRSGEHVRVKFEGDTIHVQDVVIELPRDSRIAVLKEDLTLHPIYLTREELKTMESFKWLREIQQTESFQRKIEPVLSEEAWGAPP